MNNILKDDFKRISPYIADRDAFKDTKWLITGATGMLCSYLISFLSWLNEAELEGSLKITALHRRELDSNDPNLGFLLKNKAIEFKKIDLGKDFVLNDNNEYDFVIHGASNAAPRTYMADPIGTINTNVKATQILLEHFKDSKRLKGFIYIGSGEIYGTPDVTDVPTPEEYIGTTNHLNPRSCYVESKRFAETICYNYFQRYKIPVKLLRPVHVYGPGFKEDDSRVWADFIARASKGMDIEILGDGTARRGFCYISDAAAQILAVIVRGETGTPYNIGNDEHISIRELADLVAEISGHKIAVNVKNKLPDYLQGSPQISCPSIAKVSSLFPLLKTPVKQGIERSFKWFNCSVMKKGDY